MMSRKHYREFADAISFEVNALTGLTPVRRAERIVVIESMADSIARTCKSDNSRFRYDTFFEACGLDAYGKVPPAVKSK